MNNHTRVMGI